MSTSEVGSAVPATPFHLPVTAAAGWPLRYRLDLPTLLLANFAIDVEPVVGLALTTGLLALSGVAMAVAALTGVV